MAKKKPKKKNRQQPEKRQPATTPPSILTIIPPVVCRGEEHPPIQGGPFDLWLPNLPVRKSKWPWLPPAAVRLPELPDRYPRVLKIPTAELLLQAERKFPNRSKLGEFCLWFIRAVTPYVKSSVERGVLRADVAEKTVRTFICDLIDENCRNPTTANDFISSVLNSKPWCKLMDSIKEAEIVASHTEGPEQPVVIRAKPAAEQSAEDRTQIFTNSDDYPVPTQITEVERPKAASKVQPSPRELVNATKAEVLEKKGWVPTHADIWRKAGYKSRAEYERWLREDPKRPNQTADRTFRRLLTEEKPHLK